MTSSDDSSQKGRRKEKRSRKDQSRNGKSRGSDAKKRRKRSKSRHRRRSYSSSSLSSASSSSSASSPSWKERKKRKSKKRKQSKRRKYHRRDTRCIIQSSESDSNEANVQKAAPTQDKETESNNDIGWDNGVDAMSSERKPSKALVTTEAKAKGPMTQEQYLQLQSQIREVTDPVTGRVRLVRGTGEIIERIVSRHEHEHLNALATRGDGNGYAKDIARQAMMKRMRR